MTVKQRFVGIGLAVVLLFTLSSCGRNLNEVKNEYIAYSKRDTAYLTLTLAGDNFYGKLRIAGPGNVVDSGDVRGRIIRDTLLGDFYYRPYQAHLKKRKAYVLINQQDSLVQGRGVETVYMGIPSYMPNSISFDSAKYVFYPVSISEETSRH